MRYWLPDYEKKLIGELQKQQNCAQFCDTLLQAEGISIPTHSSVLAALSLHLSQRLWASPAPPAGQKRRLQLHALKPQTLIKLIGLLYSGELEVSSVLEQRDVLAAAHLFGLPDLVEGEKVEAGNDQNGCKNCKRVEIEKRDVQIQVTPRSFRVSIGTQTVTEKSNRTMKRSQHQETTASSPQSCGNVETNTSDNSTSTACTANLNAYSEGESVLEPSTSATVSLSCPSENMTLHLSPSEDSICSRLQEGEAEQIQPETRVSDRPEKEDGQRKASVNKEKTNQDKRQGPVVEKRQVCKNVATKSLEKMQEMIEATQISIKVKLRRRRTKEEMWEVVNMQDPDALTVISALRPDNCKRPQADITAVQSSHSTDQASVPEPVSSSPKPGPHTSSALCEPVSAPSGDPVPLQPPRAVEETDEQIEKLLEDIMIGLNILPKIDTDNDKSRDLSHEQGSSQDKKDKASYCVCREDYVDQNGNCSTETGKSCCTVHRPTELCGSNSDLNPDKSSISPEHSPRPTSSSRLDADQESTPQEDPNVLELLPLSTETEDNLFSMADLQFLPCLSPLESSNNSSGGNKTPVQSFLPGQTWLMDNPRSLQFPLAAVAQELQNSPVKPGTSSDCKEKVSSNDESNAPPAKRQKMLRKVGRNLDDNVTPPCAKRRCPNLGLNTTCKDLKVKTDENINLSHCLVSLSSNNVLAKDGKRLTNTPPSEPQAPISKRLRPKILTNRETLRKTPIRTLRKSQRSVSSPETSSPNLQTNKKEKKRGRPRKMAGNGEKSKQQIENPCLEKSDEAPNEAKRPRLGEDTDEGPSKQIKPMDNSVNHKPDDNDNSTPAEKKPRMVSLKEFQELIKRQHLKTQHIKDKSEKEQSENVKKGDSEVVVMAGSIQESNSANCQSDDVDVTEHLDEQSPSTSAQRLSQSANAEETTPRVDEDVSSVSGLNSLSENSDQSEICIRVIPLEVTKPSEETEERTSPKLFDDGVTDSGSENELTVDDSLPLAATQEEKSSSANHSPDLCESKNSDAQDSKKASTRSPGGLQDDEEDVDVLLHTPDRTSVTTEGQKSVEISPDKEEEEDSNEVDVTGSETDA